MLYEKTKIERFKDFVIGIADEIVADQRKTEHGVEWYGKDNFSLAGDGGDIEPVVNQVTERSRMQAVLKISQAFTSTDICGERDFIEGKFIRKMVLNIQHHIFYPKFRRSVTDLAACGLRALFHHQKPR